MPIQEVFDDVETGRWRSTLSVLVIARDESATLPRCLASLHHLWDELILVDTGSTDDTKIIAQSYGAKIFDFPWVDDFAAARNFAEACATQDYVLWIDADEELVDGHKRIEELLRDQTWTSVRPLVRFLDAGTETDETYKPAPRQDLFHRRGSHTWEGKVHEYTVGPQGPLEPAIVYAELRRPGGDRPHSWKALRHEAEGRSDRALYYLAARHGAEGNYVEALAVYDYMLNLPAEPNTVRARAAWMKGHTLRIVGDNMGAVQSFLRAIYEMPNLAEPYFYLGQMLYESERFELAVAWLRAACSISQPEFAYDLDIYDERFELLAKAESCLSTTTPAPVAAP